MENKVCSKCGIEKQITDFNTRAGIEKFDKNGNIRYRSNCKECCYSSEKRKLHYQKNKEKIALRKQKRYYSDEQHRQKSLEYSKNYTKERIKSDDLFKSKQKIRKLIGRYISRHKFKKINKTNEILGCSWEQFKYHIESQFKEGMTWKNHGEWHFDHIKPVSLANNYEELIELNHYTNFQPLWAEENLKKSNTYIE